MNIRIFLITGILLFFALPSKIWAQKNKQATLTEAQKERQRISDSTRKALELQRAVLKSRIDSANASRKHILDSTKAARQKVTDSLTALRKYRESKRYQDSVMRIRQARTDSMRAVQQTRLDSMRSERKRVLDSATASRNHLLDSVRALQKKRSDSLAAIRKYRESKRFRDSVNIVRQVRLDSISAVRKAFNDSVSTERKRVIDSAIASRKQITDSTKNALTKRTDSINAERKIRADSLAKVKDEREKQNKIKEKEREKKLKMALELKIQKKHEEWSNEKMLKKKWGFPRRNIQDLVTHFNYYFNARRKLTEAELNMQRIAKDDYGKMLELFSFNPDRDSSVLKTDMDSIIQKVSVGVQIHDPRTKWADDMYLLLGQAYYYQGHYEKAGTSFRYVVSLRDKYYQKKKKNSASYKKPTKSIVSNESKGLFSRLKHQPVHNEGLVWLARTFVQEGKLGEAESILDLISTNTKVSESLKGKLALTKAFLYLNRKNYGLATEQLKLVIANKTVDKSTKRRAAYIAGQISQQENKPKDAAEYFQKVIDLNPKIDMDFNARKELAYSIMASGEKQTKAIASLNRMLKDGKYTPYYEQVYYILGALYANNGDSKNAITYLEKSTTAAKTTKKQKAISFAAIGDIHYKNASYVKAKAAYDSSAKYAGDAADNASVATALRRSQNLDHVTSPILIITHQDSLLSLGALSEREQKAAVRKYIKQLQQQRDDSIYAAQNKSGMPSMDDNPQNSTTSSSYSNWYFTNSSLMQQGVNDFKRRFPNRTNVDNWRRASASAFGTKSDNTATAGDNTTDGTDELDENGLPREEVLLAYIPNTQEQKDTARARIEKAYIDLSNAYLINMEEYALATAALDSLKKKYPQHPYAAQELYIRYLAAIKQNKLDEAQALNSELISKYPGTEYAALLSPDAARKTDININAIASYYETTYEHLQNRLFGQVIQRCQTALKDFGENKYTERFHLMEIIAYAGLEDYTKSEKLYAEKFAKPSENIRSWADAVHNYITKNKPAVDTTVKDSSAVKGTGNSATNPNNTTTSSNTNAPGNNTSSNVNSPALPTSNPGTGIPDDYVYKPQSEHIFVFHFKGLNNKAIGFKAGLADMNALKYSKSNLSEDIVMMDSTQGFIMVRPFANATQAKGYMLNLKSTPQIFREFKPEDYDMFIISKTNYDKLRENGNLGEYLKFYRKHYK